MLMVVVAQGDREWNVSLDNWCGHRVPSLLYRSGHNITCE